MATAIEINTGTLRSCVSDIDSARATMLGIADEAQSLVGNLGTTWQGPAASAFASAFGEVRQRLQAANGVIEQYSRYLESTVEQYEVAEAQRQEDNVSFAEGN